MATTQEGPGSSGVSHGATRPMDTDASEGRRLPATPAAPEPQRGDTVGRFVILERVGAGGMGVVFAAYDPQLDRKVALKLLRAEFTPADGGTEARARLVREGQAMAKLRHPNVVTVFDVGAHEGQVFLAMEYVAGGTLAEFADAQRGRPGGWQAIVAAYVQAARGLAAAHAAGMVHRDFKPSNVMIEGDRIQVTDFGIARGGASMDGSLDGLEGAAESDPESHDSASRPVPSESGALPLLTQTGMLMGTAAYMAPERHHGRPADALTDQFALCVSLFEALFGRRPFAGKTRAALAAAIGEGEMQPLPARTDVPTWVVRAIRRGLHTDPRRRWPSIDALLDVLATPEVGDVGRRTRVAIGTVMGVLLTVVPLSGALYGFPTDTGTYRGAVVQSVALLVVVLGLGFIGRVELAATRLNRAAFITVVTVMTLQIPMELAHAWLGIPIEWSWVLHLLYWSSMATLFAALVDRRFLVLAACYFVAFSVSLWRPAWYPWVSSINNLAFIGSVVWFWREQRGAAA
ncbi:MAG: serine/threonine-protein kinase [Myxococcota bacterium]